MYYCGPHFALIEASRKISQNFPDQYLLCAILGRKVNVSLERIFLIFKQLYRLSYPDNFIVKMLNSVVIKNCIHDNFVSSFTLEKGLLCVPK